MIKKYYKKINGFNPYSFQEKVGKKILKGKNIILQAPTGAGKTLAAVIPFLIANEEGLKFPPKLIYSLPLRTLTNNIKKEVSESISGKLKNNYKITIQTGEYPEDPKFLGDIIFTTIDQSLSSFLNIPVGLSRRMANLNAGAVLSSYLVFDEIHLLEPERSFFVLLELLKTTRMPFIIMTATLPQNFINYLQRELNAESISLNKEDIINIKSQKNRIINLTKSNCELNQADILKNHKDKTIVICNTVQKAQVIFNDLRDKKRKDTEVFLVHSRFLGNCRKDKEEKIQKCFSKYSEKKDVILVSTQVIEAGLDITCDSMHTELAPVDSLLQRFGRCARYEREKGTAFVYPVNNHSPYAKDLCEKTWNHLQKQQKLKVSDAQKLQDKVLSEFYKNEVEHTIDNKNSTSSEDGLKLLESTMDESEKKNYQRLVRHIDGIGLIIHSHPEEIDNPYEYETVSISAKQLANFLSNLPLIGFEDRWIIKKIDYDEKQRRYTYQDIVLEGRSFMEIERELQKEFLLIINPLYAYHDEEIGFTLGEHEKKQDNFKKIKDLYEDREVYSYEKEAWIEHTEKVFEASLGVEISYPKNDSPKSFYNFKSGMDYILDVYSENIDVNKSLLQDVLNFSILLHDFGKFRTNWQNEARKWEIEHGKMKKEDAHKIFFAHTDYDGKNDKGRPNFPTHAGIGAVAIIHFIGNYLEDKYKLDNEDLHLFIKLVVGIIARHHSPAIEKMNREDGNNKFTIDKNSESEINILINKNLLPKELRSYERSLILEFNKPSFDMSDCMLFRSSLNNRRERDIYSLYQIFVRVLRLSDSYSFFVK